MPCLPIRSSIIIEHAQRDPSPESAPRACGRLFALLLLWAGLQASEPGLLATYFDNHDLTGPSVSRIEPVLDASWNAGSPDAAIAPDSFSARWMGILRPRTTGNHTLYITTDDGVRLWLDGRLAVDAWMAKSASTLSAVVPLSSGVAHTLRIEYFEQSGSASARLEWSSEAQAREVIPSSCLEAVAVGAASPSAVTVAHAAAGTLLTWSMLSNDVSGFAIERTDASGSFTTVAAVLGHVRSWLDTSVPVAGASQSYRIRAVTAADPSPWVAVNGTLPTGADAVGFLATYWDNKDFTGTWLQRLDATVDFTWGSASPAAPLGVDTFSARWTGSITPPATGVYTLYATSDDGVRVWVDGAPVIDAWVDRSATTSSGTVQLTAGQRHAIRMDYYENGYNATARLEWSGPGLARSVIPASAVSGGPVLPLAPTRLVAAATTLANAPICLTWQAVDADQTAFVIERAGSDGVFVPVATVPGTARHWDDATAVAGGTLSYRVRAMNALGAGAWALADATLPPAVTTPGFLATYWDNRDWSGTRVMRIDPLIDFAWTAGSPSPHIAADTFAVRWTGAVIPIASGTYTFHATSDDGVRVWVDDAPVIDAWINRSAATSIGTAVLTGGAVHQVRMEFFENAGNATARLEWSGPGVTRRLVPACQLNSSVAPTITVAASASPSPVSGMSTTVAVGANDDGPSSALTYTWNASGPAPVSFSPNGGLSAQNAQAAFSAAGSYELTVTVRDAGGLAATSTVPVTVLSTPTSVTVTPADIEIAAGASQVFAAALHDQFGAVIATPGSATWTVSGGGVIASTSATTGTFTAAGCGGGGQHAVTVALGGLSGTATVVVSTTGAVPSIRPPFVASGTVGVPFSYAIKACNGPTAFAATGLPAGLGVDAVTGIISGIPQVAGSTTATLLASNANGTGAASLACTIAIGTPVVTWADPAPITAGTLLGASQLNATATIPGSFVYTPAAGAVLPAGPHQLAVTFIPVDSANYQPVTAYATLVVQAQVPVITWPAPAAIVYGNALTAVQLNATTTVSGTWAYQPEPGTVLEVGTHPLTVVFTPTDSTRYATATAEVSLVVQAAPDDGADDPPSAPIVTLSITGGLTGVEHGHIDGTPVSFTRGTEVIVQVTAASTGAVSSVTVSGGSGGDVTGAPGDTLTIPVAREGRVSLTASAMASLNGQTATGSSDAVVVVVDRTPPQALLLDPAADPADGRALAVGLVAAGSRPLMLNGADDAPDLRSRLGWPCWKAAALQLPVRVSDESGLDATHAVTAQVGTASLSVDQSGLASADSAPSLIRLGGFAAVPDALLLADPGTLVLGADAGMQELTIAMRDQCGNISSMGLCSVWKQAEPVGQARIGYIPFVRDDFPLEVGVLPPDGEMHSNRITTIATSADVAWLEQDGLPAERLTQDVAAWADYDGAGAVLWRLPKPAVADADSRLMTTTVSGRDVAGNAVGPFTVQATWVAAPIEPSQPSSVIVDGTFEPSLMDWFFDPVIDGGAYHLNGYIPGFEPIPEGWYPDPFVLGLIWQSRVYHQDDHVVAEDHVATRGIELPTRAALIAGDAFATIHDRNGEEVRLEFHDQGPNRIAHIGLHSSLSDHLIEMIDASDWTRSIALAEEIRPSHAPIWSWWTPEPLRISEYFYVTSDNGRFRVRCEDRWLPSIPDCRYAWNRLSPIGPPTLANAPPSWRPGAISVNTGIVADSGTIRWSSMDSAAAALAADADRQLQVLIDRSQEPGFARIMWSRNEDRLAGVHAAEEHAGFRQLDLLRVNNDVILAGDALIEIQGGFTLGATAGTVNADTPQGTWVGFASSTLRAQYLDIVPDLSGLDPTARLACYRGMTDAMQATIAADLAACGTGQPIGRTVQHRLMLAERDMRNTATAIFMGYDPDQVRNELAQLAGQDPATEAVELPLDGGIADLAAAAGDALATAQALLATAGGVEDAADAATVAALMQARMDAMNKQFLLVERIFANWQGYRQRVDDLIKPYEDQLLPLIQKLDGMRQVFYDARDSILSEASSMQSLEGPDIPGSDNGYPPRWYRLIDAVDDAETFVAEWNATFWAITAIYDDPDYQRLAAARAFITAKESSGLFARYIQSNRHAVIDRAANRVCDGGEPRWDGLMEILDTTLDSGIPRRGLSQRLRVRIHATEGCVGLYDIDIKCGTVHAYPDELSQQYAGANGAHRMKEALAVCKVQVNPIELWQLEDKEYTIRVAGKEIANSTPAADENVWIDIVLPQMTDAEAKQEVQSWTFNGDLAPHAYVCETGTGSFKKLALGDILKQTKVRILGGKVHDTAEEVLLGGDQGVFYSSLSGGHLADLGMTEVAGAAIIKKRKFEVEPRVDGRFYKAPWGSPSLYGNSATVRWVTENNGPTFNLRPDGGTVTGQNSQHTFEITLDSSTAAADLPATLERWGGQYTFQVAGQKPGVTFVQVRPVLDGGGMADPILEIPVVVELPQVAQPGVYQLEAARANASRRVNYTQSESTGDIFQHPTPEQPKMDAAGNVTSYDAMWKWPNAYKWITGQTGDQGFTVQSWSDWTEGTKDLDMLFDVCMHQLGQIVPTGQDASGKPWHAPLTDGDTLFKDPITSSGNSALYVLSVEQIRNIWLWNDSSLMSNADESIRKRLEVETTPQQLWQRARDKVQYSGATPNYVQRTDDASKKERQVLETKVRMLTDQATLARLKRYFSLKKQDSRHPASEWMDSVEPKHDLYGQPLQRGFGFEFDPLPTMGHDAMVGQFNWSLFDGPLTNLMDTDLTPGWHVGHPFTEDLLRFMITERLMAARAIIDAWDQQGIRVGEANWPIVIGNAWTVPLEFSVDANIGLGLFRARAQDATYTSDPDLAGNTRQYQILNWGDGRDALGAKMPEGTQQLYLKVRNLTTFQEVQIPVYAKTPQAGLAVRLVLEAEFLSVCLAGRDLESFWNSAWNNSPMWVMAFGVGDFLFGASSVHALVTGYDFRTGDKLTPGQYAVNAGVAALNLLPGIASITKKAIVAVRSGAASDLARSLLSRNLNLAPQAVKDQLRGVVDNLAQGGREMIASTKQLAVGTRYLLASAELKGLNVVAREVSEDLTMWFLSHCGSARMSDSILVRTGSQAPGMNPLLRLESAAKHSVPDAALVRETVFTKLDDAVSGSNDLVRASKVMEAKAGVHGATGGAATTEKMVIKGGCFPAGTPVLMANGTYKPIELVTVGDRVASRDEHHEGSAVTAGVVEKVMVRSKDSIIRLDLRRDGAEVLVKPTEEHPFWVQGHGWTRAGDIVAGDVVRGDDGYWTVASASKVVLGRIIPVYNFTVTDLHTYFVGSIKPTGPPSWVWVHNTACKVGDLAEKAVADANRVADLRIPTSDNVDVTLAVTERASGKPLPLANGESTLSNVEYLFSKSPVYRQRLVNGKRTYLRDDLFDPNAVTTKEFTTGNVTVRESKRNIEWMQEGKAPVGRDGLEVNLHHVDQTNTGALAEMAGSKHREFYKLLHDNTGQSLSLVRPDGDKAFDAERRAYWIARAGGIP